MAAYTVEDIKKLREETGAGMMDCKKALEEAQGDFEEAKELVRQRGLAKAEKKSDRATSEGYMPAMFTLPTKSAPSSKFSARPTS